MSRLLAIDINSIKDYRDFQFIISHIGQNKDYFLAKIPASIVQQLIDTAESSNFSEIQKIRALELIKSIRNNSIINCSDNKKTVNFKKKVLDYYKDDIRLEIAITDTDIPKPFKNIDHLNFSGAKSLKLEPTDIYTDKELDIVWRYLEFHLKTTPKIALVGSYNFIFKTDSTKPKPTNLHSLLIKIFNEFKLSGCRCEEFLIFSAPKEKELSFIEKQKAEIKGFLNELMRIHKIRFGIKYVVIEDKNIKKELHQRFLVTNYAALNMGSELAESKNLSVMSPVADEEIVNELQKKWLINTFDTKKNLIIKSKD